MKYYSVSVRERGVKRKEIVKTNSKMLAISIVKSRVSPHAIVTKAVETTVPIDMLVSDFFTKFQKSIASKIPINDKISTIRQIAVMTDAGIAITDTFEDVAGNISNKRLKEIYTKINTDINAGNSLSDAMKPYTEDFGHIALAMTKLGEKTGNISGSYHKLADILENIRDNIAKFKKAIRTPLITFVAMMIAFTILIMVVVPKFKDIFAKFKTELPLPTQILLKIEWAFNNYGLYILLSLIVGIFLLKYIYKTNPNFQYKVDKVLIHPKFYLINKAIHLSTMHKYNLVFGELVRSGSPVSEALETAVGMVDNLVMKEQLLTVNANIGKGMGLAESFEITGLYENMLLQMIRAGETGGQLDIMLEKVTLYYDMQFQSLIDNLSAYIEPIMLFFIAALVLLMALGIFMPMWDIGKAVNG
ncbi:MAG: type II secretion system F family protein [Sulfurovum sp.]|nr:type II secretion system F family protein [Sulfurovum sp.]MCB4745418.1 type II secretion system F family protein [Sulfurovum sp.]MCB4745695.1 type II secretion system F family protein [Sulfurovum sp.]MCB4747404.1 type II secretion system F family protein [Sulfurovum sp.]MCB4749152.1 type II secretion system F family protein [Sulfurovum sp.]